MNVMPERWQEVKKVLAGALERTPRERGAYLDQACAEAALRREVESLISRLLGMWPTTSKSCASVGPHPSAL